VEEYLGTFTASETPTKRVCELIYGSLRSNSGQDPRIPALLAVKIIRRYDLLNSNNLNGVKAIFMDAPIVKAQKLIALAVRTPHPEEARSAALAAVRIIHKNDLLRGGALDFFSRFNLYPPQPEPPPVPKPEASKPKAPPTPTYTEPPPDREEQPLESIPPDASRAVINEFVRTKVGRYVSFLIQKSILREYPRKTAKWLTDRAVANGEISSDQASVFNYYIQVQLSLKVKAGLLKSWKGHHGGYGIAQAPEAEKPKSRKSAA
jgi:hypothetical protein